MVIVEQKSELQSLSEAAILAAFADSDPSTPIAKEHTRLIMTCAAREDTVLSPVWKEAVGATVYAETGEECEEIEHRTFGHDGFDDAIKQIVKVEGAFGLTDLAAVTAPPAPT